MDLRSGGKGKRNYRNNIRVPVIRVTGSVGKTTTREMISLALSAEKKVYATPGNRNSQLGVPQAVFGFKDDSDMAVMEMGISMPGEMEKLVRMVRPDAAVITNIGITHIENLGSREEILRQKMHITKLWQDDCYVEENTLTVNVARLRKKLEEEGLTEIITTKPGSGYIIE